MATYLPGVQDYIPQAQPFKPDFNFYSNALSFRQAKYDAGYEQLNTLYSSMLNGPMSRADNIDDREKFFKTIKGDIQKMAGLDLSKEQNVVAAGNVFDQLLDNDYIAKDMAWTRNLQNQQRRGQALKNCLNPDECGGEWWEGGDRQLQYKQMEFQNMSKEQSLQARNVEYTAFQNIQEKAIELADKMDLNVSAITQDDGKWIITQTNGSLIEGDLYNMFVSTLGQDPKIKKYNTAKAYNQRMNYATSKAQELGSLDAANNDYYLRMEEQINSATKQKEKESTDKAVKSKKLLDSKLKVAETEPENYSPGLKGLIEELADENEINTRNRDIHKQQSKAANGIKNIPNLQAKLGMLDELIGSTFFENDMLQAAHTLSKRNASIERKENPYGLATYKSNLRRKEAIEKAKLDSALEDKKQGADQSFYNTTVAGNIANGDPSKQNDRGKGFKIARDMYNTVEGKVKQEESRSIKDYYKVIDAAARRGDVEAQDQLVELGNIYMKHLSGRQDSGTQGKQDLGDKDLAYWLENSLVLDSDELHSDFLNEAYNSVVKPSVDAHKKNESRMTYLSGFSKANEKRQASIDANLLMGEEIQREVKETVKKVRAEIMASDDVNHEAFNMLYDDFGAKVSREEFKERYITEERVNELMKGSSIPFGKGSGGLYFDEIAGLFTGAENDEIRQDYIKTLSEQADEFYDDPSGSENLKFFENDNKDDFDQVDTQDLDDVFEELFRKHDKSHVANKYFDSGDDAFIGDMITGNIDSAYPQTDANRLVSQFVRESGANNATEYFIPNLDSKGMLDRDEDSEYRDIASSLTKSIFADIQGNVSKATSDSRAKYRFEYSPMLDGNEGVQYLRIFPSPQYLQKMTSTSGTKILDDKQLQAIASDGIIISYPTSGSTTDFYKKSKQTAEEYMMERKGSLPIDINNQYYQNMNVTENAKGFSVTGQYLAGLEGDGSKAYRNYSQNYDKSVRLNSLLNYYSNERLDALKEMYQKNVLAFDRYKKSN